MAWHVDCFNRTHDKATKRHFPAKYESTCGASDCPYPDRRIKVGQELTWMVRGKGVNRMTEPQATTEPEDVTDYVQEESDENETSEPPTPPNVFVKKTRTASTAKPHATPAPAVAADSLSALVSALVSPIVAAQVSSALEGFKPTEAKPVDVEALSKDVTARVLAAIPTAREVVVKREDDSRPPVNVGAAHETFDTLLRVCSMRMPNGHRPNVALVGPTGSGKTHAAKQVAKALGLTFAYQAGAETFVDLAGFIDANGVYRETELYRAYTKGGVILLDEGDSWGPTAALWANAALDNGVASFPSGMVNRHPDCIVIFAANTWGRGATKDYVGRNKLDEAFLKRFVFIEWDYDAALERAVCSDATWCKRVQRTRELVRERGLRVLVTPRESIFGAELLAAGFSVEQAEDMTVMAGWTTDQKTQIRASLKK